jgi:branched-chain amino acid transport system permease protein
MTSGGDTLIRLAVQGLVDGSTYALLGISFGYILFVTGKLHFAYGFSYTLAGYAVAVVSALAGVPLWLACVVAVAAAVVSGVAVELVVYRPLVNRNPGGSLVSVFVAALGVNIAGDSLITLVWGQSSESRQVNDYFPTLWHVGPVILADVQIAVVIFAVLVIAAGTALLRWTNIGKIIRAVSADAGLARAIGVHLERVNVLVFALASVVAGVLAVFATLRLTASPDMGDTPVFYGFLVAFLAGRGSSLIKLGFCGLGVGLLSDLSQYWLSPEFSQVVIFGLLSVYVAVQPFRGADGRRRLARWLPRPRMDRVPAGDS